MSESTMRRKKNGDFKKIDKISLLPDELLVNILLFLPTKIAISTSILSKRWEFLWMVLPKLEYECDVYSYSENENIKRFIELNLPLHKAPVIESLHLKFNGPAFRFKPTDIKLWVTIAVSHCIRELSIAFISCKGCSTLPSSFYICKSLVILELKDHILVDVPRMACLPSLKTLLLVGVMYANENSLHKLLSSCPVLEDLVLEQNEFDYFGQWRVDVPSLQRLTLKISRTYSFRELVLRTPSLKYFKVKENIGDSDDEGDSYDEGDSKNVSYSFDYKDMPNLEEVDIDSVYPGIDKFVRSITSVKRLSLCVRLYSQEEDFYREGIVFNQLRHLKLCLCVSNWSKLLVRLLKDSPNLRELELYMDDDYEEGNLDPPVCWEDELNCVPACFLSSLETFKWTAKHRSQNERDLVKYILKNACCLNTATILFQPAQETETEDIREMWIQELLLSMQGSTTTCQLLFD